MLLLWVEVLAAALVCLDLFFGAGRASEKGSIVLSSRNALLGDGLERFYKA
jgi:hypothetical protein